MEKQPLNKENLPESKKSKEIVKKLRPEDVIHVKPTEPMTTEEILREMKKQGLRPATLEELQSFGDDPEMRGIREKMARGEIIEGEVVPDEPEKPLLEHKKDEK